MRMVAIILMLLLGSQVAGAAEPATADSEAAYTKAIEGRATDVVDALKLDDPATAARVHGIIVARYRELRDWHDANDAKVKELGKAEDEGGKAELARIGASRKAGHDAFLSRLSADLTPEQVEVVKDRMTYNVVNVTYNAYVDQIPALGKAQKAKIRELLVEAREIAMDEGSSKEKHAVFGKYKGKINNYLSKEGYDLKKTEKEWAERRKARAAAEKGTN